MGQGGYLTLINATPYKWVQTAQHSYQMNSWSLPGTLSPGGSAKVYVEFCEGFFKTPTDDSGFTNYTLEGTNRHFQVQACSTLEGGNIYHPNLRVDLQNTEWDNPDIQPIPPKSDIIKLGWNHDGNVTFTLTGIAIGNTAAVNVVASPLSISDSAIQQLTNRLKEDMGYGEFEQPPIPAMLASHVASNPDGNIRTMLQEIANREFGNADYILPTSMTSGVATLTRNMPVTNAATFANFVSVDDPSCYWLRRWMYKYQSILKVLTIEELSIPGTHDSGTYDMVSTVSEPWTKTQSLTLQGQMEAGARALDLRIGIQPDKSGDERFILVHDTWRTNLTVSAALDQILSFSHNEATEVIILDFHRFVELSGGVTEQHYQDLMKLVKTKLGNKLIPYSAKGQTLNEIWQGQGRIIVAWNRDNNDSEIWPGVSQGWFDKSNKSDLQSAISAEMNKSHSGLWSICAILTASALDPIHALNPDISLWFAPNTEWASKANIVSCDFIQQTQLSQSLITASCLKAAKKLSS